MREEPHTDPRHPNHISYEETPQYPYLNKMPRKTFDGPPVYDWKPREEPQGVEHPLMCKGKHQPIRLGAISKAGIYFWCKSCHGRQLVTREEIMRKWEELDQIEAENASIETRPMVY